MECDVSTQRNNSENHAGTTRVYTASEMHREIEYFFQDVENTAAISVRWDENYQPPAASSLSTSG